MRHVHAPRCGPALLQVLTLALLAPLLSGCLGTKPTVAVLIPDDSPGVTRILDIDVFTARIKAMCEQCVVSVYDAQGDTEEQKSQARQAQAEGVDVMVVMPVDPADMEVVDSDKVSMISMGTPFVGAVRHVGLEDAATLGDSTVRVVPDLEAARDIVLGGSDAMTYVPTADMSEQAADLAMSLLTGEDIAGGEDVAGIRSWLYETQDVTLDSLTSVLVAQGIITLEELCDGTTKQKCEKLGFY